MNNPFDHGYYGEIELREMGFASVGDNVIISKNAQIVGLQNIRIGNHVRIDGWTNIIAAGKGSLTLGSYIHIGAYCHITGGGGVRMDDFSGLSQGVRIYSASDDYSGESLTNPMTPGRFKTENVGAVHLGRHVIVGSGTVILPGVTIEEGSAVGAQALVTKSLPGWGLFAGAPARRVRERSKRLLELEQEFLAAGS
uniref:Transferase hexapeptide repeat containing protein n=1 Tax=Caulobacter sp. (strain K31) TaxID=366602 RepID=B0T598_CAUSK